MAALLRMLDGRGRGVTSLSELLTRSLCPLAGFTTPAQRGAHCCCAASPSRSNAASPATLQSSQRPRLLGGDPVTRIRLAARKRLGIEEDRGYEQDNTWKKMRKVKPPRGHPDRKPRHANNPRRIPDLFRITRWQQLLKATDFHHDYLTWRKLVAFTARARILYGMCASGEKLKLRNSGLLERLRDRAEELDWGEAEPEDVLSLSKAFRTMKWDPGMATIERMNARLALAEQCKTDALETGQETMRQRLVAQREHIRRFGAFDAW